MRKERPVRRTKVLPIKTQRVGVQIVFKAYKVRLPVHGIDSGTGESSVEAVNRAGRQCLRACDPSRRNHRQAAATDALYLGTGEGMLSHLQPYVIELRVRQREAGHAYAIARP